MKPNLIKQADQDNHLDGLDGDKRYKYDCLLDNVTEGGCVLCCTCQLLISIRKHTTQSAIAQVKCNDLDSIH
jgi:hypothetical protein